MMNDLNIPFFRKTMFAGMATLFLSTGVTQANPVSAGEEVTEKHAVALSQQKKVTITGIVKDVLGPVVGLKHKALCHLLQIKLLWTD